MRIHFINRFFWPAEPATAQLLLDLATALHRNAWSVSVIAGHSQQGLPSREIHEGVHIVRIGPVMATGRNLSARSYDFAVFHLAVLGALWRTVKRGDIVIALTDPPLLGVTAALIAKLRGARLIHWIHDIYPEVARAVAKTFWVKAATGVLRPWRTLAWRHAAACVTLSRDMAAVVNETGVLAGRLHIVPNWAPERLGPSATDETDRLRARWEIGDRIVIGYSGNLGRVHDLSGMVDVAENLQSDPRLLFLFVGQGAGFTSLRARVECRKLTNVRFLPPQPRSELSASLSVPDIHVIGLRPGCEHFVFPSKLYGVAAVARPVLVLGAPGSELAQLVQQHGFGAVFNPQATNEIVAYLEKLAAAPELRRALGIAAARFSGDNGGLARALTQWENILRPIAGVR